MENTRFLWPMPPSVPSRSMASRTLSRLCAGSPMPMNTTFFTARRRRARTTWATISRLPTWRSRPLRPVMQNTQPTAQPTWVETHSPPRGSSTLSTICRSASSTSRRDEPSLAGCSLCRRAMPSSSAATWGRPWRTPSGRKSSARWRAVQASRARPCSQARTILPQCRGLAPRSARRWWRSWLRMGRASYHCPS
ncbi:Uncharacterised protein [Acinetobacter baumannii]|nr:Uncharacterised protein [Acinetobacter baumannii]